MIREKDGRKICPKAHFFDRFNNLLTGSTTNFKQCSLQKQKVVAHIIQYKRKKLLRFSPH